MMGRTARQLEQDRKGQPEQGSQIKIPKTGQEYAPLYPSIYLPL